MTTTDYLMNAGFALLVLRQARERRIELRSVILPVVLMFFIVQSYVHSIPTAGNDLVLVALLSSLGLGLGVLSALTTHVRLDADGAAHARAGWIAAILLLTGICSRMAFEFAVSHGAGPAVQSFSIAHQLGTGAWTFALVSMAVLEVSLRLAIVQLRGHRLTRTPSALASPVGA